MVQKILAALDGSKTSESTLPYLEMLLKSIDSNVTLIRVVEPGNERAASGARSYLRKIAGTLEKKGACVDFAAVAGSPAEEIVKRAVSGKYDLITLCTRGNTGLKRMVLGSVAEEILKRSPVPVFVTHPVKASDAPPRIRRIVVPLDGSHRSATVLKTVSGIAESQEATLHFVTVVSPTKKESLPVETVSRNLFRDQETLRKKGLDADITILYGDPATEILTFAEHREADLVAISTHGRSGVNRILYGSVAEKILRRSSVPLLVLRTAAIPKLIVKGARALKARHRSMQLLNVSDSLGSRGPFNT